MIVNELRLSFVTIVTESAFFVTIVVTGSGPISKILHCGDKNNSGKEKKGLFSESRGRVKIV